MVIWVNENLKQNKINSFLNNETFYLQKMEKFPIFAGILTSKFDDDQQKAQNVWRHLFAFCFANLAVVVGAEK